MTLISARNKAWYCFATCHGVEELKPEMQPKLTSESCGGLIILYLLGETTLLSTLNIKDRATLERQQQLANHGVVASKIHTRLNM